MSTLRRSKAKPLGGGVSFGVEGMRGWDIAYFSSHVFLDQSAYWAAAGSSVARNAARVGFLALGPWTLTSVSRASARSFLAIVSERMTLQVLGTSWEAIVV